MCVLILYACLLILSLLRVLVQAIRPQGVGVHKCVLILLYMCCHTEGEESHSFFFVLFSRFFFGTQSSRGRRARRRIQHLSRCCIVAITRLRPLCPLLHAYVSIRQHTSAYVSILDFFHYVRCCARARARERERWCRERESVCVNTYIHTHTQLLVYEALSY
jgi:hypothetical protein